MGGRNLAPLPGLVGQPIDDGVARSLAHLGDFVQQIRGERDEHSQTRLDVDDIVAAEKPKRSASEFSVRHGVQRTVEKDDDSD